MTVRRKRVRISVGLVVMALLSAACGSRLPEEVLADIDADRGRAVSAGQSGTGAGGDEGSAGDELAPGPSGDPAGTDPAQPAEPGDAGVPAGGSGGETAAPGGDGGAPAPGTGAPGGAAPAAGAACRGGATDTGVTENEIKVASIVTASGPLPGATEGAYRAAAAYFAKVNAEGGVCGRKITILKGDDGLDPARGRAEFSRLEPQVVAFVAGFAVADSGYIDLIEKTGVPYVGTSVDPSGRNLPSVVPKTPERVAHTGPFVYFKQKYGDVKKWAFLYTDVGGVRANTPAVREPLKKSGFEIVYDSGAQATSPDYTPEVINMRSSGAQAVYLFAFEVNMQVRLARNMRQQNYEPTLKVTQIGYNSKLVELLGDVANGWISHLTYLPVINEDEPARSPAVAEFLKWNRQVFPSGQIDLFPVTGWGDAAIFVKALQMIGPDVTRANIIDAIGNKMTEDDGGGISAPIDPRTGEGQGCFVIVRVAKEKWTREHPGSGYECELGERFEY